MIENNHYDKNDNNDNDDSDNDNNDNKNYNSDDETIIDDYTYKLMIINHDCCYHQNHH